MSDPQSKLNTATSDPTSAPHSLSKMPLKWPGWVEQQAFALEIQSPWAEALMNGTKTIETRAYDLPPALLGQKIWILQSPVGTDQVSSLSNDIRLDSSHAKMIGWCIFDQVKHYTTKERFESDASAHLVPPNSGYAWNEDTTKVIYGWIVTSFGQSDETEQRRYVRASRRLRSLFQLFTEEDDDDYGDSRLQKTNCK
jgi:hypothetical protein